MRITKTALLTALCLSVPYQSQMPYESALEDAVSGQSMTMTKGSLYGSLRHGSFQDGAFELDQSGPGEFTTKLEASFDQCNLQDASLDVVYKDIIVKSTSKKIDGKFITKGSVFYLENGEYIPILLDHEEEITQQSQRTQ